MYTDWRPSSEAEAVAHPPVAHPPVAHPPVAHPPDAHSPVASSDNQPLVDLRKLTRSERVELTQGKRVVVFERRGKKTTKIAVLPLRLLLAISSRAQGQFADLKDHTSLTLHIQRKLTEQVRYIVKWLKDATSADEFAELSKGASLEEDLQICGAAMALGIDKTYYGHILDPWSEGLKKLHGAQFNNYNTDLCNRVDIIETLSLAAENHPIRAELVKHLAELDTADDSFDPRTGKKHFVEFLEARPRLADAVDKAKAGN